LVEAAMADTDNNAPSQIASAGISIPVVIELQMVGEPERWQSPKPKASSPPILEQVTENARESIAVTICTGIYCKKATV
jgi:hypothetical protein